MTGPNSRSAAAVFLDLIARPEQWRQHAACSGLDPNLFFPSRGDDFSEARAICAACPVSTQCLAAGMGEHHGVWGGTSERERRRRRRAAGDQGPGRVQARCGTESGYYRHIKVVYDRPCVACRMAHADMTALRQAQDKAGARRRRYALKVAAGWCSDCASGSHAVHLDYCPCPRCVEGGSGLAVLPVVDDEAPDVAS